VFAVGRSGTILHYDGRSWSPQTSPIVVDLTNVSGTSATDVYAVGVDPSYTTPQSRDLGIAAALHYNGTDWTADTVSQDFGFGTTLWDVWAGSPTDVYAVGSWGIIVRRKGTQWILQTGGTNERLFGIWGRPGGDAFAVGSGVILRGSR